MIFFTPVIVKYMKKNPQYKEPCYSEQILSAPWPYVISVRSAVHCNRISTVMWFLHCRSDRPKFNFQLDQNTLACKNIRFSSLFASGDISRGGTSATQWQKFHTDDANQCLHNKSGSHGVPNIYLSNFMCLLVDFGKHCVHLSTCSSKSQMLLLEKTIFHNHWLFC